MRHLYKTKTKRFAAGSTLVNVGLMMTPVLLARTDDIDFRIQDQPPVESSDADQFDIMASGFARFIFSANTDSAAGGGDFTVQRIGTNVLMERPLFEDSKLSFNLGYEYDHYDFTGTNTFLAGTNDPFSDINYLSAGAAFLDRIDDEWTWGIRVGGEFFGESGVSFSDASTIIGTAFVRYQINPDLLVIGGVYGRTQIEDDALVLPFVGLDWTIDEQWSLTVGQSQTSRHPRLQLNYQLSPGITLGMGAEYQSDRFRLENDGVQNGAVIEDSSIPIFFNLLLHPNDQLTLSVEAGVVAAQEFQIEDQFGRNARSFDSDAAAFAGLSLIWRF